MEKIIKAAVDRGASDLHIKAGDVFRARIDGKLVPLTKQRLTPEQTKAIALRFIPGEEDRARIDRILDFDCSWGAPGIGRFRINILKQRSSFMIVMRVIPFEVPTLEQLHLPAILQTIASAERGMILVTGLTGSGKSSTMAAMIDYINRSAQKHIVTLENPIEFLHRDVNCSLTQREIGTDTESVRAGLRAALRQDPDVILISEMRDPETIDTAMTAAESGHLLLATLDTPDVAATVSRLVSVFPPEAQDIARVRMADALHAVVSQRLLPRRDGHGRVPALEVMTVTPRIRELLLDRYRTAQIREYMAEGRDQYGMQTFDQDLMALIRTGQVSPEAALANATNASDFEVQAHAEHPAAPAPVVAAQPPPAPRPSARPAAPPAPKPAAQPAGPAAVAPRPAVQPGPAAAAPKPAVHPAGPPAAAPKPSVRPAAPPAAAPQPAGRPAAPPAMATKPSAAPVPKPR